MTRRRAGAMNEACSLVLISNEIGSSLFDLMLRDDRMISFISLLSCGFYNHLRTDRLFLFFLIFPFLLLGMALGCWKRSLFRDKLALVHKYSSVVSCNISKCAIKNNNNIMRIDNSGL